VLFTETLNTPPSRPNGPHTWGRRSPSTLARHPRELVTSGRRSPGGPAGRGVPTHEPPGASLLGPEELGRTDGGSAVREPPSADGGRLRPAAPDRVGGPYQPGERGAGGRTAGGDRGRRSADRDQHRPVELVEFGGDDLAS